MIWQTDLCTVDSGKRHNYAFLLSRHARLAVAYVVYPCRKSLSKDLDLRKKMEEFGVFRERERKGETVLPSGRRLSEIRIEKRRDVGNTSTSEIPGSFKPRYVIKAIT